MSNNNQNRRRPNLRRPPTPVQRVSPHAEKKPVPSRSIQHAQTGEQRSYQAKSKTPNTKSGYQARSKRPPTTTLPGHRPTKTEPLASSPTELEEEELTYVFDEELEYYPPEEEISVPIIPKKKPQATGIRPSQRKITPPPQQKPQRRYAPQEDLYEEIDDEDEVFFEDDASYYGGEYTNDAYEADQVEEWVEPEPVFAVDWQALRPDFNLPEQPSMFFLLGTVGAIVFSLVLLGTWLFSGFWASLSGTTSNAVGVPVITAANGQLAPFFTPSVRYWEPQILQWSERHQLDPNMIATIMQIESCGDPQALSVAGAQGLFQVMPFHFQENEDPFDADTNALRGMNYLADRLQQTNGDVGRAFAGYNGGHTAAAGEWNSWPAETQRYYKWSIGIYGDVLAGQATSETLTQWLAAGGVTLCTQAEQRLGLR